MFSPSLYAERRQQLARTVGSGLILIPGNDDAAMNYRGNVYAFRQDGSFLYYGGLDAPGLALTIDAESGETTLYGHDPTIDDVIWEGELAPISERAAAVGIQKTAPPEALSEAVRQAQAAGRAVHTLPPYRGDQTLKLAGLLGVAPAEVAPSDALMDAVIAQRLVKGPDEVREIERALDVADAMHRLAMRMAQPGRTEHEIAGAMEGLALSRGSFPPFPIILTKRGETLHNHASSAVLEAGDLLLVDAGAAAPVSRYASDVTRVAPVGGTFSERQRAIVDLVLAVQLEAIDACRPGVPFRDVHRGAAVRLATGLTSLGLMTGDPEEAVEAGAHALFFPHGLGHAMGLDVHDMESLGEDRVGYGGGYQRSEQFGTVNLRFAKPLAEGHVMTVEPGCYFIGPLIDLWKSDRKHAGFLNYDEIERWRGLGGVRIEDDVLVVAGGPPRVLGPGIPKTPGEIEAEVAKGG